MEKFYKTIFKYKAAVAVIFVFFALLSGSLTIFVNINYNMADYLPKDSHSTVSIEVLNEEFPENIPNARVMVKNVNIEKALVYKSELMKIEGISDVKWLDDVVDLQVPLELIPEEALNEYYKNENAIFNIVIDGDLQVSALNNIYELDEDMIAVSGPAADRAFTMDRTNTELRNIFLLLVPVVFIILIFATTSWILPFIFLLTIAFAISMNMGSNIVLGEISFVTAASAGILQFAVSMDYSIFLLNSYSEHKSKSLTPEKAMLEALKSTFKSITASAVTTATGFLALIFMRFRLGPDMGIVLAKGIFISLVCSLVFLPLIVLIFDKTIEKTKHRSYMPGFKVFSRIVAKIRIPAVVLAIILTCIAFVAQNRTSFLYGASEIYADRSTRIGRDREKIKENFGVSNQMALLVEKGFPEKEKLLNDSIVEMPSVISVISYESIVGLNIPTEFLSEEEIKYFYSDNFARFIIVSDAEYESSKSFNLVEQIRSTAKKHYGENYYLAGESASTYDIKSVITSDDLLVRFIAVIGILIILMIAFKSISIPIFLLFAIQSAIWINLSIPYFRDDKLFFLVYLIMNSILLGATVDYAILYGNCYLSNRRICGKKGSILNTVSETSGSIITSASILSVSGFFLGFISSNAAISQIGFLLGTGAILSAISVLIVLPGLLYLTDGIIIKTTKGTFY